MTIGSLNRRDKKAKGDTFSICYFRHHNALLYNREIGPYEIKKIILQYNTVEGVGRVGDHGVHILYHASSSWSFGNRPMSLCAAEFFRFFGTTNRKISPPFPIGLCPQQRANTAEKT